MTYARCLFPCLLSTDEFLFFLSFFLIRQRNIVSMIEISVMLAMVQSNLLHYKRLYGVLAWTRGTAAVKILTHGIQATRLVSENTAETAYHSRRYESSQYLLRKPISHIILCFHMIYYDRKAQVGIVKPAEALVMQRHDATIEDAVFCGEGNKQVSAAASHTGAVGGGVFCVRVSKLHVEDKQVAATS